MNNILTVNTLTTKEEAIQFLRNRKVTSHTVEFSNIDFSGTHFNFTVDFSNCIFNGPANFSDAIFYREAIFDLAVFHDVANFDRATFRSSASFKGCSFESGARFVFASFNKVRFLSSTFQITAIFWNSFFNQDADFSHCVFDFPKGLSRAVDKETNFSWAIFQGRAIFTHAKFFTPVYFWRTIFKENALFSFCVFDDEVKFGGRPSEVHFIKVKKMRDDSLRALENKDLFVRDAMLQFGDAYIYNNVYSTGQLESELDSIGSLNEKEKTAVINEWELGHYNVFQENKTVSFDDAHFNKLKLCSFKYINYSKVILAKNISGTKEYKELFTAILTQNSYDFFISYAHEQKDFAGKLHERLSLFGKIVWFDADDINKGEELLSSIKKGLANSSFFIMIFSKEYFVKNWTKKEFDLVKLNIDKLIPIWHNVTADDVRNINPDFADFADIIAFKSQDYSPDLEKLSLDIIYEAGKR